MSTFKTVHFSNEYSQLTLMAGPEDLSRLMVGISEPTVGRAVILTPEEVDSLLTALHAGENFTIEIDQVRCGLSVTKSNRGDPYREGLSVQVSGEDWESWSFFVENGYDRQRMMWLIDQVHQHNTQSSPSP